MKILTLTNMYPSKSKPYYGIFVQEQVDELKKSLDDIDYLFLDGNNMVSKYLLSIFRLWQKLNQFKPDILHVHFGLTMLPVILLYPLLKYRQCKIVLTLHGGDVVGNNFPVLWITKLGIRISDLAICVSEEITNKVKKQTNSYLYLPCGIASVFKQNTLKREKIVVFPSSPTRHEKNYALFCLIIDKVRQKYKVPFEVKMLENLSRAEVANVLQTAACMLMTSHYEGSPQAVKEAILCGLPVVSTPAGDVPLLLKDYDECVVSADENELTAAVCQFLSDHEDGFLYGEKYQESLSNRVICQEIIKSYQQLVCK